LGTRGGGYRRRLVIMRLIILGKNTDDKGTQLEQLTEKMLEHQGLTNIVLNKQTSGGNELDANAEKVIEQIGSKPITIPVLCECKAHNAPITLPDWLKFVGKLCIERKKRQNTIGLMIALSGANGAVMGSLSDDFFGDDSIQLIANDALKSILSSIYQLPAPSQLRGVITKDSNKTVEDLDVVYYNKRVYWLISFEDNGFTLYSGKGEYLDREKVKILFPLVEKETSFKEIDYVDLRELRNQQKLEARLRVYLIRDCIKAEPVTDEIFKNEAEQIGIEISDISEFFAKESLFCYDKESKRIALREIGEDLLAAFYKTIFSSDQVPVELLLSQFYHEHINDAFLGVIKDIQYGFDLEPEYKEKVLFILRHSPSALLYSLTPDPVYHSSQYPFWDNGMKRLYQSHFLSQITECFKADFTNQSLSRFLFESGIYNLSVKTCLSFGKGDEIETLEIKRNFHLAEIEGTNQVGVLIAKDEEEQE